MFLADAKLLSYSHVEDAKLELKFLTRQYGYVAVQIYLEDIVFWREVDTIAWNEAALQTQKNWVPFLIIELPQEPNNPLTVDQLDIHHIQNTLEVLLQELEAAIDSRELSCFRTFIDDLSWLCGARATYRANYRYCEPSLRINHCAFDPFPSVFNAMQQHRAKVSQKHPHLEITLSPLAVTGDVSTATTQELDGATFGNDRNNFFGSRLQRVFAYLPKLDRAAFRTELDNVRATLRAYAETPSEDWVFEDYDPFFSLLYEP